MSRTITKPRLGIDSEVLAGDLASLKRTIRRNGGTITEQHRSLPDEVFLEVSFETVADQMNCAADIAELGIGACIYVDDEQDFRDSSTFERVEPMRTADVLENIAQLLVEPMGASSDLEVLRLNKQRIEVMDRSGRKFTVQVRQS